MMKSETFSLKTLKEFYRDHPIRKKVREFVLQGPAVLCNSYSRYESAIQRFQKLKNAEWSYLNALIQRPNVMRAYEREDDSR